MPNQRSTDNARRAYHGESIVLYAHAGNDDVADDATDAITDILHYVAAKLDAGAAENVVSRASMHFRDES